MIVLLAAFAIQPVVCIDPGHPSEVGLGTKGKYVTEVAIAWDVAVRMKKELVAKGVKVVMTKSREREMVENVRRAEIANEAKADLMVRLHCDAAAGTGFAIYWPAEQGTARGKTGPAKTVIERTRPIAKAFHKAFAANLGSALRDNGIRTDKATYIGGKQGALTGSIFSEVPVILVEMCVLTNPRDEAFIRRPEGRQTMARALARATMAAISAERG